MSVRPQTSDVESMLCVLIRRSVALISMDGSAPPVHHRRLYGMIQKQVDALLEGMPVEEQERVMRRALRRSKKETFEDLVMELESNRRNCYGHSCRAPSP